MASLKPLVLPAALGVGGGLKVEVLVPTTGGASNFHLVAAGSTNATNIKASPGVLYGYDIFNNRATPIFVKFHNTAGTPTAGAGVVKTVGVQAGTRAKGELRFGMDFSTGIAISIVTGIADADANAVTASDCVVDVDFK